MSAQAKFDNHSLFAIDAALRCNLCEVTNLGLEQCTLTCDGRRNMYGVYVDMESTDGDRVEVTYVRHALALQSGMRIELRTNLSKQC